MGDFFGSIYSSFFGKLYGLDLSDYVWGQLSPAQDENLYGTFGFVMLITTLLSGIVYYFVIDRHSLCHWWCWFISLLIPGVINFFTGFILLSHQANQGKMIDEKGNDLGFAFINFFNFGIANFLMVIIVFILFTLFVKILLKITPLQSDCSTSPF